MIKCNWCGAEKYENGTYITAKTEKATYAQQVK